MSSVLTDLSESRARRHGVKKRCHRRVALPKSRIRRARMPRRKRGQDACGETSRSTIQTGEWTQVCRSFLTFLTAGSHCASNRNPVACNSAAPHSHHISKRSEQGIDYTKGLITRWSDTGISVPGRRPRNVQIATKNEKENQSYCLVGDGVNCSGEG